MKFSNELEALINDAIADGVITPEEQAALLKKALLSGADPKDVEAEINSRLAQMKATMPPTPVQPVKPKASVHDLDSLIEEYLTDGIISDKERQVLLRKAQGLGLDLDEVDLYIDAQQQKADQKVDAAVSRKRGATCPYCGGSIPQLADKCPHCGQNITAEASEELQEIFDHLEDALIELKSGYSYQMAESKAEVERYVRKAKMYYENNPKVKRLLDQVEEESEVAIAEAKKEAQKERMKKFNKEWLPLILLGIIFLCGIGGLTIMKSCENAEKEHREKMRQEEIAEEKQKLQQALGNVQEVVNSCIDKKDLDGAARALTMCAVSDLGDIFEGREDATALYTSLVTTVVDAYLDKGQKKKAQNLLISCSVKYHGGRYDLSDLFKKLGSDSNYRFKGEEGYEKN